MKAAITKSYGKKGDTILNMNYAAVDRVSRRCSELKPVFGNCRRCRLQLLGKSTEFVDKVVAPMNAQEGDKLPVSAFSREDGTFLAAQLLTKNVVLLLTYPNGTLKPIQCNQCSYVCPHAAIRPVLLTEEEAAKAPAAFKADARRRCICWSEIQNAGCRSGLRSSCGSCAVVCPAPNKALGYETSGYTGSC